MILKDGTRVKMRLKTMKMNEVSSVDKPAMEPATKAIIKRAPGAAPNAPAAEPVGIEKGAALTNAVGGHTHLVSLGGCDAYYGSGMTDYTDGHCHPWIKLEDGTIQIGEAYGHTHNIAVLRKAEDTEDGDQPASTSESRSAGGNPGGETTKMAQTNNDAAANKAAETQTNEKIAKLEKRVERSEKIEAMSGRDFAFYKTLSGEQAEEFLSKDADGRTALIKNAEDSNPVVYTAADGATFRKNDDPRLLSMAKAMDGEKKKRMEMEAKAKKAEMEKRASEFSHLPESARLPLVKALDSLEGEEREEALKALKAADAAAAGAFVTRGTSAAPSADESPDTELDRMAKSIQEKEPTLTFDQAMTKALETPAGAEAYAKSVQA